MERDGEENTVEGAAVSQHGVHVRINVVREGRYRPRLHEGSRECKSQEGNQVDHHLAIVADNIYGGLGESAIERGRLQSPKSARNSDVV